MANPWFSHNVPPLTSAEGQARIAAAAAPRARAARIAQAIVERADVDVDVSRDVEVMEENGDGEMEGGVSVTVNSGSKKSDDVSLAHTANIYTDAGDAKEAQEADGDHKGEDGWVIVVQNGDEDRKEQNTSDNNAHTNGEPARGGDNTNDHNNSSSSDNHAHAAAPDYNFEPGNEENWMFGGPIDTSKKVYISGDDFP